MTAMHTPTTEDEEPRFGLTVAIAVACFAIGVATVAWIPKSENGGAAPSPSSSSSASRGDHDEAPVSPAASNAVDVREAVTGPSEHPEATPDEAAGSATAKTVDGSESDKPAAADMTATANPKARTLGRVVSAADETAELSLIQGRVAYFRCDGLRTQSGKFPCPRDAVLEQAVWEILSTLPSCSPSLGRGGADIRLDLGRVQRTEVRVLPIHGSPEPALDSDRVYACVGKRLVKLRTSLEPIYMMVSFRASLR